MKVQAIKTKLFYEGDALVPFIRTYIKKVPESSVIVVTSKIVALAEGRTVEKNSISKEALIRKESTFAIETKDTWLTIKDGALIAAAGIDESNANGKYILLPSDSWKSAETIRKELMKIYKVKKLGVIVTDSRLLPLRAGVVGIALGYAGFKGVRDYRGQADLFGPKLEYTRTDIADSLATSAVLVMGEGRECKPLALITDVDIIFANKVNKDELYINPKDDMYGPFFKSKKFKF